MLIVVGPDGTGKTTLVEMLAARGMHPMRPPQAMPEHAATRTLQGVLKYLHLTLMQSHRNEVWDRFPVPDHFIYAGILPPTSTPRRDFADAWGTLRSYEEVLANVGVRAVVLDAPTEVLRERWQDSEVGIEALEELQFRYYLWQQLTPIPVMRRETAWVTEQDAEEVLQWYNSRL